ncbi:MAG: hypothetical protein A4E27_00789 [Methanobacterium sp. PtaU1.Bin242]|nr:MAG: hypothetical protein A4E27_00789 [Methanobacterium sp. PtaU1.Bin242]
MKQDYDYLTDSLFLYSDEEYRYKKSVRITADVILDFDQDDVPVALELLNASKILHVKKSSLNEPVGLDMQICVGEDTIKLEGIFFISIHKKEIPKSLNKETPNRTNLTASGAHFATA